MKWGAIFIAVVALAAGAWYLLQPVGGNAPVNVEGTSKPDDGAMVTVKVPATFSDQEQTGKRGFEAFCAKCHGANAQGIEGSAPPLVHKIYEPSHHGDMAFILAAQNGVRSHHWKFGNMPPVDGVTKADVKNIVTYIRALQRENGIQ